MYSKQNIFEDSGPFHITAPNWNDVNHRRSVMASLVKAVKELECDRQAQLKKVGSPAQAPPWWKSFHFVLRELLNDNTTHKPVIFGAVFEFMPPTTRDPPVEAPRFVIALRGTMLKRETALRDLEEDYGILTNDLHQSPRFQRVLSCAKHMVDFVGVHNYRKVWLAGYSLGAAIALLVGKEMTRAGYPLETYIFNPPFVSLSLEWLKCCRSGKLLACILRTIGRGMLARLISNVADSGNEEAKKDPFAALKHWQPHLFLNSNDLICSGYKEYFEARKLMKKMKILRKLENLATRDTVIRRLLSGQWDKEEEPIHLLASAELNINKKQSSVREAHEIQQWWSPGLRLENELCQY